VGPTRRAVGTLLDVPPAQSSSQVVDIVLERAEALRITYDDGVLAEFPIRALRDACPCADCRGRRDDGRPVTSAIDVRAVDAELHGNWGIAIRWSDGHDTGIYSWELLRRWWDAGTET
jgi:DUF971 family protein